MKKGVMIKFFWYISCIIIFLTTFCFAQELVISEVYIDGTDEWIELTNVGSQPFVGTIQLVGLKTTSISLDVFLDAGGVLLLGDTMEMVVHPVEKKTNLGFSLPDTKSLHIELFFEETLLDSRVISTGDVQEGNDLKTSFEKKCIQGVCAYELSSTNKGVLPGYIASPGVYNGFGEIYEQEIGSGSSSSTGQTMTGTLITGGITTGFVVTGTVIDTGTYQVTGTTTLETGSQASEPISEDTMGGEENNYHELTEPIWGDIRIVEVHPNDTDVLKEYIIIESSIVYTGPLRFIGLGQGETQKVANVSLSPGDRLIITDNIDAISPTEQWYTFPSLTLSDGGETLSIYIDDTLIDSISYTRVDRGSVATFTETGEGVRVFSTEALSSVTLKGIEGLSCIPSIETDGSREEGITPYVLSMPSLGENYCDSWYAIERLVGDKVYEGCSITPLLSGGQHFVSVSISSQQNVLCSSFNTIYNHIPLSERQDEAGVFSGIVAHIEEIYPWDTEQFPEYIELKALSSYSGALTIGGLGQGTAEKTIHISVFSGERFIITDKAGVFPKETKTYILPSISLTNAGEEISVYGQDRQEVDKVVYTKGIEGKSLYYQTLSGSAELFFTTDPPTPGFAYAQAAFLFDDKIQQEEVGCSIHLQHTKPFFAGNKVNLIAHANDKDIQNSSTKYSCEWFFSDTSYVFAEGCNPSYYEYGSEGVYTVGLRITDIETQKVCQTSLDINYPNKISPTGSSETTRDTYYQGLYKKWKERFETLKKEAKSLGYSVSTSGYIVTQASSSESFTVATGVVSIIKVLPNPSGSDTDREQIVLRNISDEDILLVEYRLYNGTSRKKMPDLILPAQQDLTVTASLGLTNRASCIYLQKEGVSYDVFCYPQAQDDQRFDTSLSGWERYDKEASLENIKNISLKVETDQACIFFNKESLLCKRLGYTNEEVKQRKKDAKKYTTTTQRLEKETTRAENRRTKYKEQVAKRKGERNSRQEKVQKEKATTAWYRRQNMIHANFVGFLVEELQHNRSPLFYGSDLYTSVYAYRNLVSKVKNNDIYYNYHGLLLPLEEVKDIIELTNKEQLPLVETDISVVYEQALAQTQSTLASFSQNLRKYR